MRKLRRNIKKGLGAAALAALCIAFSGQAVVYAAEAENPDMEIAGQEAAIGEAVNSAGGQAGTYALGSPNGEVIGDGVRIRTKPSLSAPILGLMYYEDEVSIVMSQITTNSDGTWCYIKHIESGIWGWASAKYILCWDAI